MLKFSILRDKALTITDSGEVFSSAQGLMGECLDWLDLGIISSCGTCFFRIVDRSIEEESLQFNQNEKDLLRINSVRQGVLCCQHKGNELKTG